MTDQIQKTLGTLKSKRNHFVAAHDITPGEKTTCAADEGPILPAALPLVYMPLLGIAGWALQTWINLETLFSTSQRKSAQCHKWKLVHSWLKNLQANSNQTQLCAITNAAVRKENNCDHALRETILLACCDANLVKPMPCHVHVSE